MMAGGTDDSWSETYRLLADVCLAQGNKKSILWNLRDCGWDGLFEPFFLSFWNWDYEANFILQNVSQLLCIYIKGK